MPKALTYVTFAWPVSAGANNPPVISCPTDPVVVTSLEGNGGNSAVFDLPPCIDAESGQNTIVICTPPSGSFFGLGSNTVTCTCFDPDGATDECTITVQVGMF